MDIPARIGKITKDKLLEADEVFMASTAEGIMPIRRIDDRILSNGAPGPVTIRLRDAYWTKRDEGWHATPIDYAEEHG